MDNMSLKGTPAKEPPFLHKDISHMITEPHNQSKGALSHTINQPKITKSHDNKVTTPFNFTKRITGHMKTESHNQLYKGN